MPKVLVTNGRNSATWYYGLQGELYDLSHIKHGHFFVKEIDNDGPAGVHFPDGLLLYTEEEYNEILKQQDEFIADLTKHAQEMVDLRRELEEVHEGKKVKLPQEVAHALDLVKFHGEDNAEIVYYYASGEKSSYKTVVGKAIADFASDNFDVFLTALVNGYTVEEEPSTEDKIRERLAIALVDENVLSPVPIERLAELLTLTIREVLAEDRAKEETT